MIVSPLELDRISERRWSSSSVLPTITLASLLSGTTPIRLMLSRLFFVWVVSQIQTARRHVCRLVPDDVSRGPCLSILVRSTTPPKRNLIHPCHRIHSTWRQARRYFCRYTGIEEIIWLDVTPRQLLDSLPRNVCSTALFFNDPFMTRYVNNNERHHSASHKFPGVYTIFQHTITNPILS
jgi:hypothetical protein